MDCHGFESGIIYWLLIFIWNIHFMIMPKTIYDVDIINLSGSIIKFIIIPVLFKGHGHEKDQASITK